VNKLIIIITTLGALRRKGTQQLGERADNRGSRCHFESWYQQKGRMREGQEGERGSGKEARRMRAAFPAAPLRKASTQGGLAGKAAGHRGQHN